MARNRGPTWSGIVARHQPERWRDMAFGDKAVDVHFGQVQLMDRDVGGHRTVDGRRVKMGQLYRSVALDVASEADLTALANLGIRSVFDLRTSAERRRRPDRVGPRRRDVCRSGRSSAAAPHRPADSRRCSPRPGSCRASSRAGPGEERCHPSAARDRPRPAGRGPGRARDVGDVRSLLERRPSGARRRVLPGNHGGRPGAAERGGPRTCSRRGGRNPEPSSRARR